MLAKLAGEFERVSDVGAVFPDADKAGVEKVGEGSGGRVVWRSDGFSADGQRGVDREVDFLVRDDGFAVEMGFECGHAGTS